MRPLHDGDKLELLLRDLWMLANHAARTGKLPSGSGVFRFIGDLERKDAPDGNDVERLYHEIDVLAKAVAPVTLERLRRGSFQDRLRHGAAITTPFVIGMLTLLLTLYLAFQSSQLHKADIAIREYQEWVAQQPKEKLYAAWKMYRYERVLNVTAPPLAPLDAYQRLIEEARRLVEKGQAIQQLLLDSANLLYFPRSMEEVGPDVWRRVVVRLNSGSYTARPDLPQSPDIKNGQPVFNEADCKIELPLPTKVIAKTPDRTSAKTPVNAAANDENIDSYFGSFACFLARLKIPEEQMSYPASGITYQIKSKINLLVAWLLPGLYGLLGSCVFVMRDLVVVRAPKVNRDTTILNSLSLSLRIALGGLAGIIIGWFWVPAPTGNDNAVVTPISSIPFGIAFLAGFYIETLFSQLDRLHRTLGGKDEPKAVSNGR